MNFLLSRRYLFLVTMTDLELREYLGFQHGDHHLAPINLPV
jgi:hypothetical protein